MGSVMMPAWAVTLIAGVIIGLIAAMWRDTVKRIDGIATKLDGHVTEDAKAHERLTAVEIQLAATKEKATDVGNRLHRFMAEERDINGKLHQWLTERFSELHVWITEKVIAEFRK
jgi:hypothetical protein